MISLNGQLLNGSNVLQHVQERPSIPTTLEDSQSSVDVKLIDSTDQLRKKRRRGAKDSSIEVDTKEPPAILSEPASSPVPSVPSQPEQRPLVSHPAQSVALPPTLSHAVPPDSYVILHVLRERILTYCRFIDLATLCGELEARAVCRGNPWDPANWTIPLDLFESCALGHVIIA
ncbi:hypothetical protein HKX48_006588 [Thoreauomyces humboldtii]|nr:hypothetical protein HKX48_006588 [Thoreauomyces humboldtii]